MFENDPFNTFSCYPHKITDNIYLGCEETSQCKENLKGLGVTHILIAGNYLEKHHEDDFKYYSININDSPTENILNYFDDVYNFIDKCIETNGKILIHCSAGISRSTTCLVAYLIKKNNQSVSSALNLVRKKRRLVCPNKGFQKQLKKWEDKVIINVENKFDSDNKNRQITIS